MRKTTVTPTHIDGVVIDDMHVVNEILLKTFADEFNKRIGNYLSMHQ